MAIAAISDDFDKNNDKLLEEALEHQAALDKKAKDMDDFNRDILSRLRALAKGDPMMMFLALFVFANDGSRSLDGKPVNPDANRFGLMDDDIGITGKSLLTMSGVSQVGNALEDMSNDKNGTPDDLRQFAKHLDKTLDQLTTSQDPGAVALRASLDPAALKSLVSNFKTIRADIHIGDGSPFDGDAKTAHFDPSAAPIDPTKPVDPNAKINSFGELHSLLSEKGDLGGATEAMQLKTDAFNTNTSTVQSVNAALNEQVTQQTNFQKNVQAFYVNFLHAIQDQIKAIMANMGK